MVRHLLAHIRKSYSIATDEKVALHMQVDRSALTRSKNGRAPFGPKFILRVHDAFGMEIRDIKALIAQTDEVKNVDD